MRAARCNIEQSRDSFYPLCFGTLPPYRYLVAWALVIIAALIRRACFQALGCFFTFSVSIQDHHRLIRSGPYSVVRHPGYSAWIILTAGIALLHIDNLPIVNGHGSSLFRILEGWYNLLYILLLLLGLYTLLIRADVEDTMLRQRCGQNWVEYSRQVPCQFVPFLW